MVPPIYRRRRTVHSVSLFRKSVLCEKPEFALSPVEVAALRAVLTVESVATQLVRN
jgi:hypothetical protein